ncbi:MAG TPA: ATP-binding protein [Thermoanaerobaculia bacterium]|nr:ATP-binding protein [Thermoanaerobaculia bacterium]
MPFASGKPTRIGFRRDVRLFFGSLVGFLSALILILLLLLQGFLEHARDAAAQNRANVVRMTLDDVERSNLLADSGSLEARLTILATRYDVAGVTVVKGNQVIRVGVPPSQPGVDTIVRPFQGATFTFVFDAAPLRTMTTTFIASAVICVVAIVIGTVLLFFYLPRITAPIEHMLDTAKELEARDPEHDEQQYLIDTFRKSIATLREQEVELQRMHDAQKERADDLERVTGALTRSLSSGFLAIDPQGRVVEINAAGREILRVRDNVAGEPIAAAFGDNAFADALRSAVEQGVGLRRVEIALGGEIIGLTTVPLLGESLQLLGVLALFTDLTPIRNLETRVRELQTLADLGEISTGIAHEFRNSLATILGYLRLVRQEPLPEKALAAVARAETEATELSAAVTSLLTFASPMRLSMSKVDLRELLCDLADRLGAPDSVRIECDGESVVVDADAALLARAFENLLRNAVDAVVAKGGGAVRVTIADAPRPLVRIEDDGIGIEPADVPRLLLPFQSQKSGGYGLGLPLSRKIALLHNATLELTGEPGRGATATVTFAAETPAALPFVTIERA